MRKPEDTPVSDEGIRFTPRMSSMDEKRFEFKISADDWRKYKSAGRKPVGVRDLVSGNYYTVKAAPCGARCYCDAVVVWEDE